MPSRDSLHRLIDDLPESEITRAERLLDVLKETAQPVYTLENAPDDDEPESADEAAAVAEACGNQPMRSSFGRVDQLPQWAATPTDAPPRWMSAALKSQ